MISVTAAKQIVEANTGILPKTNIQLINAAGCVLAEDVLSPIDSPSFNQAAMDGYAFEWESTNLNTKIPVTGNIPAGTTQQIFLTPGTAARIFTGAPVPDGADTIIMQEHIIKSEGGIIVTDKSTSKGNHVRLKASQISIGSIAAKAGTKLTPGSMGYLSSLGVTEVWVYTTPKAGIIVTGKELVFPGTALEFGQVYECNTVTLTAALLEGRLEPAFIEHVDDDEALVTAAIENGLQECDVLLITGGISVGKYDFVQTALQNCGVETLFYKVKQKPGKPLFFGKKGDTLVFGLPGNPAAVLTCFYEYVVPCIRKMIGMSPVFPKATNMILNHDAQNKQGLTSFLKGKMHENSVEILDGQESYKLNTFTDADCLVVFEEGNDNYKKDEIVTVHKINECWI